MGRIEAIWFSQNKGVKETSVGSVELGPKHGLAGNAHAGDWHRQVSLIAAESIHKAKQMGLEKAAGEFGETLTTSDIDLVHLPAGTRLLAGEAVLEITQIGDCVMLEEGVLAKVIRGGKISKGDSILVDNANRIAILTVSDKGSRGERIDTSKNVISQMVKTLGVVTDYALVPDEQNVIADKLCEMTDFLGVDLILTTGGTGLGPRDVTPEATLQVVQRLTPGFNELMRAEGLKHTPRAALSRAVSGIRGRTLIVNLPGSPKGAGESLGAILPVLTHGLETLRGLSADCAGT